jgi:hypothetical protein
MGEHGKILGNRSTGYRMRQLKSESGDSSPVFRVARVGARVHCKIDLRCRARPSWIAAKRLGKFLARGIRETFGSERPRRTARCSSSKTIECLGLSDALYDNLYHNLEHTILVTTVG